MALARCPTCGEEEDLSRVAVLPDGQLRIRCERCADEWVRGIATSSTRTPIAKRPVRGSAQSGTKRSDPIVWEQRALELRANATKRKKFEKLQNSSVHHKIVGLNRAYLAAAVPDPGRSELRSWIVSCLPGTTWGRQSAVNMRTMEVFVIHAYEDDPSSLSVFVIVDGAYLRDQKPMPGVTMEPSNYKDGPPTQMRASASGTVMLTALANAQFALACRKLATGLMSSGFTMQWKGHNFQLADAILDRRPLDGK